MTDEQIINASKEAANSMIGQGYFIIGAKWHRDQSQWIPKDLDNPWPTKHVLSKLIWATEHLLIRKGYDGHNYEELNICVSRAKEILSSLELPEPPKK